MNPYEKILNVFRCSSYQELYSKLEFIAKNKMGLDGVPFSLSSLEHPTNNTLCPDIFSFIEQCLKAAGGNNSDDEAIKLNKFLKENPPKESYENPELSEGECSQDDVYMINQIFHNGIDLPGSKHNPNGHLQYFSSFFIDMFFGNYTKFDDYVKSLSKEKLQKAMRKREGYCQFNPIFASILGLKLNDLENSLDFTSQQKQEIRSMYTGCKENKHQKILKNLIKLGADVNTHDINGFTPLHYAVYYHNVDMVRVLLKHGSNPNSKSRNGLMPLSNLVNTITESGMRLIDILIQHNAKLINKRDINLLRTTVEIRGSMDLAIRVREAHPRDREECEKCEKPAPKSQCGACGLVSYCTSACQKLDWKFHKVTCQRNRKKD